jgi:hypothetical protein
MYVLQIKGNKITHSNKISMLCSQKRGGRVKLGRAPQIEKAVEEKILNRLELIGSVPVLVPVLKNKSVPVYFLVKYNIIKIINTIVPAISVR